MTEVCSMELDIFSDTLDEALVQLTADTALTYRITALHGPAAWPVVEFVGTPADLATLGERYGHDGDVTPYLVPFGYLT